MEGLTGLKNLGNTCFMNSCLQMLSHTPELTELLRAILCADTPDFLLSYEYVNLVNVMRAQEGVVVPRRFLFIVHQIAQQKGREIFTGFAQNDATEFLQFLIDCFEEATRAPQAPLTSPIASPIAPPIADLFYGSMISKLTACDGAVVAETKEPFFILNLPIAGGAVGGAPPTLQECLAKFTEPEMMDGENKWYNEKTEQYEPVTKHYEFCHFPRILVITLKRFQHVHKDNVLVLFPEILEIGANGAERFELYGVCNHIGNVFFGHYTAFVKVGATAVQTPPHWVHFNDERVDHVPAFEKIITPMAYCLFYRRI
jgi:ubiquitin C-terminal hydrolase